MIGGIVWRVILVVIAVITLGAQLDRQARQVPAFAATVPEPLRYSSQLPVAAYTLVGDDPAQALEEAERLVRRRPLPAEHLRILAQAQVLAGQDEQGSLSIQYAAQRGWRDPLAQETMLRLALAAGDNAEAARRYTALFLRRDTQDALLLDLGPQVLGEPQGEGRSTLAAIVGGGDRWHRQFFGRGVRVMPPDAFAEVVGSSIAAGARYDCRQLEQSQRQISARSAPAGAQMARIVANQC